MGFQRVLKQFVQLQFGADAKLRARRGWVTQLLLEKWLPCRSAFSLRQRKIRVTWPHEENHLHLGGPCGSRAVLAGHSYWQFRLLFRPNPAGSKDWRNRSRRR